MHAPATPPDNLIRTTSHQAPRKVMVATVMRSFRGTLEERLDIACELIDRAAAEAQQSGRGLDLFVLPEHAFQEMQGVHAEERAVPLEGKLLDVMGAKARAYNTYVVVPVILREDDGTFTNSCVLLDREGRPAGIYRKCFPVMRPDGSLEGGITAGREFPVFDCDFGRIGFQICWDASYDEGWSELARQGAELVVFSTASPQTVRPAAYALRGRYYVVTSTPRNNATIFNPTGMIVAQITDRDLLVQEIDLAFAILHWTALLNGGQAFTSRYGERAGYQYSEREDTGLFWSNDPNLSIGSMMEEIGLEEWHEHSARSAAAR